MIVLCFTMCREWAHLTGHVSTGPIELAGLCQRTPFHTFTFLRASRQWFRSAVLQKLSAILWHLFVFSDAFLVGVGCIFYFIFWQLSLRVRREEEAHLEYASSAQVKCGATGAVVACSDDC